MVRLGILPLSVRPSNEAELHPAGAPTCAIGLRCKQARRRRRGRLIRTHGLRTDFTFRESLTHRTTSFGLTRRCQPYATLRRYAWPSIARPAPSTCVPMGAPGSRSSPAFASSARSIPVTKPDSLHRQPPPSVRRVP